MMCNQSKVKLICEIESHAKAMTILGVYECACATRIEHESALDRSPSHFICTPNNSISSFDRTLYHILNCRRRHFHQRYD